MMSLNLKLQSSAVKSQAKTIELELKKQEAKEKQELLDIIQVCHTLYFPRPLLMQLLTLVALLASALR